MSEQISKLKGIGDIVIAVDATSSMQPCIDGLKNKLQAFVDELANLKTKLNLAETTYRFALITFKDLWVPTDTNPLVFQNFKEDNNIVEFKNLLNDIKIEPYQGGDEPESVLEALYVAAHKPSWKEVGKAHRIVVLFTDNPPLQKFNKDALKKLGFLEPDDENMPDDFDNLLKSIGQVYREKRIKNFIVAPEDAIWEKLEPDFYNYLHIKAGKTLSDGLAALDFESIYKLLAKTISS